jgi:hypothetical protein
MKLLQRTGASLVVAWTGTEKRLLEALSETYPLHHPEAQPLSRESKDLPEGAEDWLHAARADEVNQHNAWLKKLIRPENFVPSESGWQQEMSHADAEILLQVLNNIRVGAWSRLGCPEVLPGLAQLLSSGMDANAWLILLAGELQMGLLLALEPADPDGTASSDE